QPSFLAWKVLLTHLEERGPIMGLEDKTKNSAENLGGKAKEVAGDATDNDQLKGEGKADQVKASVKDAVEKAKDKISEGINKITGN
ncbi:CsbD family protein, partial [Acidipropionibacterium jensenii]|uniref:CsbD family protein n=1 Tax=Acidipropionibacterium jensenii TaxID=1749 RepID=UPI0026480597